MTRLAKAWHRRGSLSAGGTPEPDVDLAHDVVPLRTVPQECDQTLEVIGVLRGVLEPDQKIERLAEIAPMVKSPGHRRQEGQ